MHFKREKIPASSLQAAVGMTERTMAAACVLVLLALFSLPARVYVNVSSCGRQVTELPQLLQTADAVIVLRPLAGAEWSLFPSDKRLPQALKISAWSRFYRSQF